MGLAVTTDVSKEQDVERLAQAAVSKFGRIDVWINNAGVGALGRFEDIPIKDHVRLVETNLIGVIQGSHFAMRQFRKQRSGTLINIGSIAGKIGTPYYAAYSATKFGVVGLGSALRQELHRDRVDTIHVCTVIPMPLIRRSSNMRLTTQATAPGPIPSMTPWMLSTPSWTSSLSARRSYCRRHE